MNKVAPLAVREAMWLCVVGDLITHAWLQAEAAAVSQLSFELAGNAEENVTLLTPVIRAITR